MEMSYIKLNAKNKLVKNHFRCFIASIFPYLTLFSLSLLNYYLFIFLKNTDFASLSSYAHTLRPTILTVSIVTSFVLWRIARFITDRYFYLKNHNPEATLKKTLKGLSTRQFFTAASASLIKFYLGFAWAALYLSPCAVMTGILVYSIKYEEFNRNLSVTLSISALILLFIGFAFLYVTLKRYTMTDAVIFTCKEKYSLKAIEKSIKIMEGNTLKYSLYCLSFLGWFLSCFLIIPAVYVLPYKVMAKYSFYDSLTKSRFFKHQEQKPIIFYVTKTVKE